MRHPELTSLIGLRDNDGERLVLVRFDRSDGTRGYALKVGAGSVSLTPGDLTRLSNVIGFELFSVYKFRVLARAIWLMLLCGLVWLLTSGVAEPLFAYPWSN